MAMECAGGGAGGDHPGNSDPNGDKKRYHRHTAEQIQLLEATFKNFPHPDEKIRSKLSRETGLSARQIKFWFQNRRTQVKSKGEMADNFLLRAENDKIRRENLAMKEALNNAICQACGGPPVAQDVLEEQRLRYENAQLKEELERVSSITVKYIGRPLSQLAPAQLQPNHLSSLDLSMGTYAAGTQQGMATMASNGPLLDLGHINPSGLSVSPSNLPPSHPLHLTALDKSLIADIAASAMDVLITLFGTHEPLWTKSAADGRDVLDIDSYERMFPRPNTSMKNPNLWTEASRATGDVMMNSMQLADMFVDSTKWGDLFPTIVSKAKTVDVITTGLYGNQNGIVHLMYEELQVASPLVPVRQFIFIRYRKQIDHESWAIVDVSYDFPQGNGFLYGDFSGRRLPSGCLIQSLPNGYSKVTWVEHVEVEEKTAVHRLYRDLIYSGLAFGAERWVACLQRSCERIACQMVTNAPTHELGGVIPSAEGRRSMMKLAQQMVNNFCSSIAPSNDHLGSCISDFDEFEIHAMIHKSNDPSQPNAIVLGAAATVWLPLSPQFVFDFLRDERNRPQWDMLSNHSPAQEVTHIANGAHPGNCISVLRPKYDPWAEPYLGSIQNTSQTNILMLQESCTDSSGSLVVYCPVDLAAINIAMSGQDLVSTPLLPSGFAITTDGRHSTTVAPNSNLGGGVASSGSLVTVVLQMVVNSLPWGQIGEQSLATINNLVGSSVRQIKAAMNCSSTTT